MVCAAPGFIGGPRVRAGRRRSDTGAHHLGERPTRRCSQPTPRPAHSADGSDLPDSVVEALLGCDLILHCGDIDSLGVLDRLSTVAPVIAVRTKIDPIADGVRLHEGPLLIRAGHTLIGMSTDLPDLTDPAALFGTDVDLALSGTSHVPSVAQVGSTLLVNPGSPTIPLSSSGPTVATIELDGPRSTVRIVHLPSQP